jgi:hypothetical protein
MVEILQECGFIAPPDADLVEGTTMHLVRPLAETPYDYPAWLQVT